MTLVDADYLWSIINPMNGFTRINVKNVLDNMPKFKTDDEWSRDPITEEGIYLYRDWAARGYYLGVVKKKDLPYEPQCEWIKMEPTWQPFFPKGDDFSYTPTTEGIL